MYRKEKTWETVTILFGLIALVTVALVIMLRGTDEQYGQTTKIQSTNNAEMIADCIAEEAYTHPRQDRYQELMFAVSACDLTMTRVAGE